LTGTDLLQSDEMAVTRGIETQDQSFESGSTLNQPRRNVKVVDPDTFAALFNTVSVPAVNGFREFEVSNTSHVDLYTPLWANNQGQIHDRGHLICSRYKKLGTQGVWTSTYESKTGECTRQMELSLYDQILPIAALPPRGAGLYLSTAAVASLKFALMDNRITKSHISQRNRCFDTNGNVLDSWPNIGTASKTWLRDHNANIVMKIPRYRPRSHHVWR